MDRFLLKDLQAKARHPLRFCLTVVAALWLSVGLSVAALAGTAGAKSAAPVPQTSLTLDGVTLSIQSAFLPASFLTASVDNMTQMASAVAQHPYREFQIEAIPFNTKASLESLPVATDGGAQAYRSVLHQFRAAHGGQSAAHPTITVFGQKVTGEANIVQLHLDSTQMQTALITEFVVQAGPRLWLIRLTQELTGVSHAALMSAAQPFLSSLASVTISSSTLDRPSAHVAEMLQEQAVRAASGGAKGLGTFFSPLTGSEMSNVTQSSFATQLNALFQAPTKANRAAVPFPGWWSGVCDYNNYYNATGWQSWQMNGGLDGVYPCGPRPAYGGPDHAVNFYPGSWGALEFECVELSLRWMYLAYGVRPYPGNGKDIVANYSSSADGGNMVYYTNNTACCIVPQPGDVLSYCSTCTFGHTSVVMSTSVNGSGNGSITVMEQNVVHNGEETLTVSNYEVTNTPEGWVYAYLHEV